MDLRLFFTAVKHARLGCQSMAEAECYLGPAVAECIGQELFCSLWSLDFTFYQSFFSPSNIYQLNTICLENIVFNPMPWAEKISLAKGGN